MVVINAISMTAGVFTFIFAYIVSFDIDLLLVARARIGAAGRPPPRCDTEQLPEPPHLHAGMV